MVLWSVSHAGPVLFTNSRVYNHVIAIPLVCSCLPQILCKCILFTHVMTDGCGGLMVYTVHTASNLINQSPDVHLFSLQLSDLGTSADVTQVDEFVAHKKLSPAELWAIVVHQQPIRFHRPSTPNQMSVLCWFPTDVTTVPSIHFPTCHEQNV